MTRLTDLIGKVFGGNKDSHTPQSASPKPAPNDERDPFAEANNDFALTLYRQLLGRPKNLFLSPFSIRTALGMALAGARGETAAQMRNALRVSSDETLHAHTAEIVEQLNKSGGGYEMAVANSLWGQDGAPLQPAFLDLIARYYGGGTDLVDFRRGAEAARAAINRWVEDRTRQKIQDLIPSGGVNAYTRLILANAVHFKGRWVEQFDSEDTRDEPFHLQGGGKVEVPLMYQKAEFRYLRGEGYQAVDLAYLGSRVSMLALLPDRKDGLVDLEKKLTVRMLGDGAQKMVSREVKLYLPRFKITWGAVNLGGHLSALGMPLAFTGSADFSGINGLKPPVEEALFLSAVFHKAFVEVNEEGTEAAAASAIKARVLSAQYLPSIPPPVPIFRADHPFLFAIRDRRSGVILFLGRLVDPTPGGDA